MKNPIMLHVNCFEQDPNITIEEMCRKAVSWGFDGIEFRRKRVNKEETPTAYLDKILEGSKKSGMKHVMFGGPGPQLMQADVKKRQTEIEECLSFYNKAAERFELSICNIMSGPLVAPDVAYHEFDKHGSAIATEEHWAWAKDGFSHLGKLAASNGFKLAFEIHPGYLHDLPASSKELVDKINHKNIGLNLDLGNLTAFTEAIDFSKVIKECGDYLFMLHLKNMYQIPLRKYKKNIICPLSEGVINYRLFFKTLKEHTNFNGPIVIEFPGSGDREYFAVKDIEYLKGLLRNINF
jgi:sugar phosphate isomerase/epimerase